MACDTSLAKRLVLEYKRTALLGMALEADFVFAHHVCCTASFEYRSLVRVMAIGTAHFAFKHPVMIRKAELCPDFQMALEAGFRILARIDDCMRRSARLNVQASWTMAGLAPGVFGILTFGLQSRMFCRYEIARYFIMTVGTSLGAHKLGSGNAWRRHYCLCRAA